MLWFINLCYAKKCLPTWEVCCLQGRQKPLLACISCERRLQQLIQDPTQRTHQLPWRRIACGHHKRPHQLLPMLRDALLQHDCLLFQRLRWLLLGCGLCCCRKHLVCSCQEVRQVAEAGINGLTFPQASCCNSPVKHSWHNTAGQHQVAGKHQVRISNRQQRLQQVP